MLTHDSTELTDPGVVPSLADRWSHHTDGTHLKVVPCHWRATPGLLWRVAEDQGDDPVGGEQATEHQHDDRDVPISTPAL
jgi:hypothetical protein